jgi:hypothetical protein
LLLACKGNNIPSDLNENAQMDATRLCLTLYGYRRNDNFTVDQIREVDPGAYSLLVDMIAQDHVYEPVLVCDKDTTLVMCKKHEKDPSEQLVKDVMKSMKRMKKNLGPNADAVGYVCVCVCVCDTVCVCVCVCV